MIRAGTEMIFGDHARRQRANVSVSYCQRAERGSGGPSDLYRYDVKT
jgi:hypothetical protein